MSSGHVVTDPSADVLAMPDRAAAALMDETTFQTFYRTHAPALWSYLRRTLGDAAQADDVMQEAFCKLLGAPVGGLEEKEQRAYLFRIATNLAIDHWRHKKRERQAIERMDPQPVKLDEPARACDLDLARTFATLKPRERSLLWLAYVEGAAHEEIARSLDLKPRSIKVLLFRARRRLAGLLRSKGLGAEV
jgi:RNA polymerase sigma-70 factor (ECF subfamily)